MRGKKRKTDAILLISLVLFLISGPASGLAQEKLGELEVVTELANVRTEPDIGSPIIHLARQGDTMELLGKEGPWYHIKITVNEEKTIQGYVHESLVREIHAVTPEQQEKETKEETKKEKKIEPEQKDETEIPEKISKPPKKRISYPSQISQIHLHLSGGGNYSLVGDLNQGSQGFIDYYQNSMNAEKTGEFYPLHLNYLFGGEVSLSLNHRIHVGIGAEYLFGQKESTVNFPPPYRMTITTRPQIEAIPVRIHVSYHISPEFYIKSGVEYILAECTYFYRTSQDDTWQEWRGEADASQLGGFLGLGYVYDFGPHFSFFIEASGRYAQIKNLKGEHTQKDSGGSEYEESGYMYIYQGETPNKGSFPLLFVRDKKPAGYGVSNPEKAVLDLTGLSLQMGLRIKFSLFQ